MENEKIQWAFSYNGTIGIESTNMNAMSLIMNGTTMSEFVAQ